MFMRGRIRAAILLLGLFCFADVDAQSPTSMGKTLIVGVKESPPFAMKRLDGSWHGISIDLWRNIAAKLELTYELREFDLQGLLNGVQKQSLDLAVAALTITTEREKVMDFTHPFYTTGFGIAVPRSQKAGGLGFVRVFLSWQLLQVIGGLLLVLLLVGVLAWLSERKKNPQQFGGGLMGIWSGFWWAAVTMTTVGYGDKAPQSVGGRIVALIWMFAGLIIISGFIAGITSALTLSHLASSIRGPDDLARAWVATVPGSTSESYLRQHHFASKLYPTPLEGLQAVARGEVDAMVYDAPLLRYLVITQLQGNVDVLPATFDRQMYGIALQAGSPLRESINRELLAEMHSPEWQDILYRYLGK
jgi:polar amino acid transport system substrate-binding protein